MSSLKPLTTKDAPGYRRSPVRWDIIWFCVWAMTVALLERVWTRHPTITTVTAVGPAQPREELLHDQVVIVDQSGKTVLSPVMSRSDAIIEVDRWNNGYYHPNKELLPVGWVAVEVTRKLTREGK